MKKSLIYYLLLIALTPFITACEEDYPNTADLNEAPKAAVSIEPEEYIGLNLGLARTDQPPIRGTAQADAGLTEVVVTLLKESGDVVLINETTFDPISRIIYVIDTIPEYTADVTGFRINAVDEQGRDIMLEMPVETYVNPTFDPVEGLVGTTVTVTGPEFDGDEIESVMIGETEVDSLNVAADGSSLTFKVPEGAINGNIVINRTGTYAYESAEQFRVLSEEPKVLNTYTDIVVNAQGSRNDGVPTAFSAQGNTFLLSSGEEGETSRDIDFITADSGGDDALDLFAPGHGSWLPGNYFEGPNDVPVVWPTLNVTQMMVVPDAGQEFFENATLESIQEMTLESPTTRVSLATGELGVVILFVTAEGEKGLVYFKEHDPNAAVGSKADIFTFDIKVVE